MLYETLLTLFVIIVGVNVIGTVAFIVFYEV